MGRIYLLPSASFSVRVSPSGPSPKSSSFFMSPLEIVVTLRLPHDGRNGPIRPGVSRLALGCAFRLWIDRLDESEKPDTLWAHAGPDGVSAA